MCFGGFGVVLIKLKRTKLFWLHTLKINQIFSNVPGTTYFSLNSFLNSIPACSHLWNVFYSLIKKMHQNTGGSDTQTSCFQERNNKWVGPSERELWKNREGGRNRVEDVGLMCVSVKELLWGETCGWRWTRAGRGVVRINVLFQVKGRNPLPEEPRVLAPKRRTGINGFEVNPRGCVAWILQHKLAGRRRSATLFKLSAWRAEFLEEFNPQRPETESRGMKPAADWSLKEV